MVKHEVVGVIGETVAVPCNCTPAYSHLADKPALILWYKDRSKLPIYRWAFSQQLNLKVLIKPKDLNDFMM